MRSLDMPDCPPDLPGSAPPERACREWAATPEELFRKLDAWQLDALVIPHGTTWGFYTPPGSAWDKQLQGAQHDPARQMLIEVFSGHGNSEELRSFAELETAADGTHACPAPRDDYRIGAPSSGTYVELLSSDDAELGGSGYRTEKRVTTEPTPWQGQAQSMRLRLPPLGVLVLAPAKDGQ